MQQLDTVPADHPMPLRFVGSGSEYFRIWIVNLLLTIVTIGIYYPFAKVRKLRYFHGVTEVDGHALSFHGNPWKMLRGYLLMAFLFGAYSAAGQFSPLAGAVALLIITALWPALWQASLRFRLANTGWRGLRARFTGSRADAYRAYGIGFVVVILSVVLVGASQMTGEPQARGAAAAQGSAWLALLPLLIWLAIPWLLWSVKRYQHEHYSFAGEATRFGVTLGSAYMLALRSLGVLMLAGALVGSVAGMVIAMVGPALRSGGAEAVAPGRMLLIGFIGLIVWLFVISIVLSYFRSRVQNMVWNGTTSQHLRFESRLRARSLAWLSLRNWLLVLCTLGLYYPFAAIATTRMRVEALTLVSSRDPDQMWSEATERFDDAAGDAAGDLLGIDFGL